MIVGANVECASTPVGMCAERCALGKAKVGEVFSSYCWGLFGGRKELGWAGGGERDGDGDGDGDGADDAIDGGL